MSTSGAENGTLLATILTAHPGLRGTLVDLAGPAAAARRTLTDAGLGDRCDVVAASFFEPLPAGADAYILSGVLHDCDDAHALEILRRCAAGRDRRPARGGGSANHAPAEHHRAMRLSGAAGVPSGGQKPQLAYNASSWSRVPYA
ncbi:MAG TPA: methyltransferase [Candidatus Limnocylindria bacterium]|nr:methyltransferase [Candidatus Limnocylindria bacterium]